MTPRLVSAVLLVMSAAPAFAEAPKPADAEAAFWSWFATNEAKLAEDAKKDPSTVMNDVSDRVAKIEDGLIAEMEIDRKGKQQTLVISADGNVDHFAAVKRVVAAAPKLEHWTVVAFRPRRALDTELDLGGRKFRVADFSFKETARHDGKVDVAVFVKGAKQEDAKVTETVGYLFMDGIVGEYDMETKVGAIDFAPLPAKAPKDLQPLTGLAKVVDSLQPPVWR